MAFSNYLASCEKIFENLKVNSLADLVEVIPNAVSSDAYISKASESFETKNNFSAFHYLALSHSTLLYHRLVQKLNDPKWDQTVDNDRGKNIFPEIKTLSNENMSESAILRPSCPEDTKMLLELLPSDWTVVQITSEMRASEGKKSWRKIKDPIYTPTIYISRCKCGLSPSIIIKKVFPPDGEGEVRSIVEEMEQIKSENRLISKNYKNKHEDYLEKRDELNNRLRVLVRSMEIAWLRQWCCLFVGSLHPNDHKIVEKIVKEAAKKLNITLTDEQMDLIMLMVCIPVSMKSPNDIFSYEFSLRGGIACVLNESVRSDIVKGLTSFIKEQDEKLYKIRCSPKGPVVLVLDKSIVTLPWEMIHVLQNQPVTRMPSFHSLVLLYLHHAHKSNSVLVNGVNVQNGFFVLDPENNLPRTKERLRECFSSTKWPGVTGQTPIHNEFKDALTNKDVFVYVGHGSGSQYMPAHLVESLECNSLVLLYGCSSTSLMKRGTIPDPWGVVLNYLIAFCPCVVGMLWEVMDKDTDLLTREMVKAMRGIKGPPGTPLEDPPTDIALLVSKARPLCSWYLISSALSVYGLPLQIIPAVS